MAAHKQGGLWIMGYELTVKQESARLSLSRALNKCYETGLSLRVFDGSVFVIIESTLPPDEIDTNLDDESGYFGVKSCIDADGGAGV